MANTLGLLDSNWSLAIQLLGVGIAFSLGLFWPRGKSLISAAALLGIIINIVAQNNHRRRRPRRPRRLPRVTPDVHARRSPRQRLAHHHQEN